MSEENEEKFEFYLNFVLVNAQQLVSSKIEEKVDQTAGSMSSWFGFGKAAASVATAAIDADAKIIGEMAPKLEANIVEMTKELGINMECKKVFQSGPLFVVHFKIVDVNPVEVVRHGKGEEGAQHFQNILEAMTFLGNEDKIAGIKSNIMQKVKTGMMDKMAKLIPSKIEEQANLKVEVAGMDTADEAEWLFSYLDAFKKAKA